MYWLLCADFFLEMEITAVLNFMNELTKTIIKSHIIAVLFTLDSKKMN